MEPQQEYTIEWRAYEHRPLDHSPDWFWALGIVALAGAATSIILGNILFGILIFMAGVAIGTLALKSTRESRFVLGARYLLIDDIRYSLKDLRAFWIDENRDEPLLLIDTPRFMAPDLVIPLRDVNHESVRDWFLERNIPQKELHESVALKVLETIGF